MQTFIWLLILLATLGTVSYFRMKLFNATLVVATVMVVGSFLGMVGGVLWLLFLIIALPLNIESIRKKYMTAPILDLYKKIMP
ncbi:MAG: acyl-CoA dehydrogenase, partial [Paraglaciecola sp.]